MKKISTVGAKQIRNFREQELTIGLDLGDRSSWYCVLVEAGEVLLEQKLGTTPKAMKEVFGAMPRSRIAGTGEGSGDTDRADLPTDAGRSTTFPQEPRRGLLCWVAAGAAEVGAERTADAHQQGGRSVSKNLAGAMSLTAMLRQRSL
jgi:hypothetical protein